jgi:hypothetical protein
VQPREHTAQNVVENYTTALRDGAEFPPIKVYFDGAKYWPADGIHTTHAHREARRATIRALVWNGTREDAILASLSANAEHGLQRTILDKRRAVRIALAHPEWSQWSNNEIAKRCAVTDTFVGTVKRELVQEKRDRERTSSNRLKIEPDGPKTVKVSRNGTEYEMNTSQIGPGKQPPPDDEDDIGQREEQAIAARKAAEWAATNKGVLHRCKQLRDLLAEADRSKEAHIQRYLKHITALEEDVRSTPS